MRRKIVYYWLVLLLMTATLAAYTAWVTPERRAMLGRISAQSLQGHVSFLASDLLEGRDTPSRGLDLAAEYIASQFRRAGLKPAGDNGYFQTAHYVRAEQPLDGAELTVRYGDKSFRVGKEDLLILSAGAADFSEIAPVRVNLDSVNPDAVAGKVIVATVESAAELRGLNRLKPAAALIAFSGSSAKGPEMDALQEAGRQLGFLSLRIHNHAFSQFARSGKSGPIDARISLHLAPPVVTPVNLKNVAGLLPGSDPALANTYVLVTAHYDHLGMKPDGDGDRIYNGANDDASGVATVIEVASALAAAIPHPRRSVLFMAYFGEEKDLLGSRYYGRHPLFPLRDTIADLNLEQLGRTDGDDGRRRGTATMTGYGYSEITAAFELAGKATGVRVYSPENNGDAFFDRSDNQSLADRGVPSTTIVTNFDFPDYHRAGDEWEKLDYPNLEKVDRTIALTVAMIADDPQPPRWNESNPRTEKYVRAWKQLR